ncbi:unnamed protein product [Lathyrus sativus]|nr:unnamed protein product [Lathyrus sativus]
MKLQVIVISAVLFISMSEAGHYGWWFPIRNLNEPYVREIVQFALTEHQKQSGVKLSLVDVIDGHYMAGEHHSTLYKFWLAAKDESATKKYDVGVNVQVDPHVKRLVWFDPAP